jgi:hypothetical protein
VLTAGTANVVLNQQTPPTVGVLFAVLGDYDFSTSGSVEVSTVGTNGFVIIDAVQFVQQ